MLKDKTIILGVSSSIAAYKACDLITALRKEKAEVMVVMTKNASKLIPPLTLKTLSQNTVYLDEYDENENIIHISLAKKADLLVIAPATANIISKAAAGIADDLLSTTILSVKSPVIFAPAMNQEMWKKEVIQENVKLLKKRGYIFAGPILGNLACGDIGIGKMAPIEDIVDSIKNVLGKKKALRGVKILITSGGTKEKIDDVRYIGNNSSGKMGYCLAKEANKEGADVTLIMGAQNIEPPGNIKSITVENSLQMKEEVINNLKKNDVLIMAAAVSDFKPDKKIFGKIKKEEITNKLNLSLVKTDDILKEAGRKKGKKIIIGFSLGTNGYIKEAKKKLKEKNIDFILANTLESLGSDNTQASFLTKSGKIYDWGKISKEDCAKKILNELKYVFRSSNT